jgi:hypothetical protein
MKKHKHRMRILLSKYSLIEELIPIVVGKKLASLTFLGANPGVNHITT